MKVLARSENDERYDDNVDEARSLTVDYSMVEIPI